jgi:light-regulated signal transduction histidine kinase (bacteriophytochrome)
MDQHLASHALKNHLAIILGYVELLLQECASDDPRREDLIEMHKAALAAVALLDAVRDKA